MRLLNNKIAEQYNNIVWTLWSNKECIKLHLPLIFCSSSSCLSKLSFTSRSLRTSIFNSAETKDGELVGFADTRCLHFFVCFVMASAYFECFYIATNEQPLYKRITMFLSYTVCHILSVLTVIKCCFYFKYSKDIKFYTKSLNKSSLNNSILRLFWENSK